MPDKRMSAISIGFLSGCVMLCVSASGFGIIFYNHDIWLVGQQSRIFNSQKTLRGQLASLPEGFSLGKKAEVIL
jgi:hypothetical protein